MRSSVTFLLTAKTLADTFENKPGSGNLGRGPNSALTCHLREVLHRWASLSSLWQGTPLVISKKILSKHWTIPWTLAKALFPCRAGGAEGKGGCEKHYKHIRLGGWLHREGNECKMALSFRIQRKGIFVLKSPRATFVILLVIISIWPKNQGLKISLRPPFLFFPLSKLWP